MKRTFGSKFILTAIVAIASLIFMEQGSAQETEYQVYWGDVHGHTSYSDGKGSLDHYFVHARDGSILYSVNPSSNLVKLDYVDNAFEGNSYYYLRVTQVDKDELGNPSRAWSSPIWVK